MYTKIIDGKQLAKDIKESLKVHVQSLSFCPGLAVILVGDDAASQIYVNNKVKACHSIGVKSYVYGLPSHASQLTIENLVLELNGDASVHGILVQLPLPKGIDRDSVLSMIDSQKDVDGLSLINAGRVALNHSGLRPCTPQGIVHMIMSTGQDIRGKHAVVIGRSNIVGRPLAQMLINLDATVTVCHSHTVGIQNICRQADILVVAIGLKHFVNKGFVKKGATVIDVGINREGDKLYGDVDFDSVQGIAGYISPVPGGVGPMTIAMLLSNLIREQRSS